jgi:hypothetical protein
LTMKNAIFWDVGSLLLDRILYRLLPATCWTISTDLSPLLSIDFPCTPLSLPSCSYIAGCFRLVAQSAATCSSWFLARGFFYREDGGDIFFRNVGSRKIYTAPHPRRRHSSLYFSITQPSDQPYRGDLDKKIQKSVFEG